MNKVSDENLKNDLSPLFINQTFITDWLKNWRESYLRLLDEYKIRTIKALQQIIIDADFSTDNFFFIYEYNTVENYLVRIKYIVTDEWIKFEKGLGINVDEQLLKFVIKKISEKSSEPLKQFITIFNEKNENYFKKTNYIMLGDSINTKVIRMTADNLNQKEEIVLNVSTLRSCELDDLLK
jgi:hypothetical protein